MKILHILDHSLPELDGYAIRSAHIVRYQAGLGLEPVVLTSSRQELGKADTEVIDGIKHYRTPANRELPLPFIREMRRVRRMVAKIEQLVATEKPDVLHAHSPCLWGEAAACVAKRRELPLVYEIRGFWEDAAVDRGFTTSKSLRYRMTRALETRVAKSASVVTTIAEHMKDDLVERGIYPDRIVLVPNGVDCQHFTATPADETLIQDYEVAGRTCIGYIGSLYVWEGVEDFVRSAQHILSQNPDVLFFIIGGGEQEEPVRQLIDELDLAESVKFVGRVSYQDVLRYYSILDILVYPRKHTRHTETVTPLKPLEAMSMEKAIVVSDVGGLSELIAEGTGMTFRAGDPVDLAEKCMELISNPARRVQMGNRARAHMLANRDWKVLIHIYRQVYSVASNGRPLNQSLKRSHQKWE